MDKAQPPPQSIEEYAVNGKTYVKVKNIFDTTLNDKTNSIGNASRLMQAYGANENESLDARTFLQFDIYAVTDTDEGTLGKRMRDEVGRQALRTLFTPYFFSFLFIAYYYEDTKIVYTTSDGMSDVMQGMLKYTETMLEYYTTNKDRPSMKPDKCVGRESKVGCDFRITSGKIDIPNTTPKRCNVWARFDFPDHTQRSIDGGVFPSHSEGKDTREKNARLHVLKYYLCMNDIGCDKDKKKKDKQLEIYKARIDALPYCYGDGIAQGNHGSCYMNSVLNSIRLHDRFFELFNSKANIIKKTYANEDEQTWNLTYADMTRVAVYYFVDKKNDKYIDWCPVGGKYFEEFEKIFKGFNMNYIWFDYNYKYNSYDQEWKWELERYGQSKNRQEPIILVFRKFNVINNNLTVLMRIISRLRQKKLIGKNNITSVIGLLGTMFEGEGRSVYEGHAITGYFCTRTKQYRVHDQNGADFPFDWTRKMNTDAGLSEFIAGFNGAASLLNGDYRLRTLEGTPLNAYNGVEGLSWTVMVLIERDIWTNPDDWQKILNAISNPLKKEINKQEQIEQQGK